MTVTVDQTVEQFTATPRQLFINGQWTDGGLRQDLRDARTPRRARPWPGSRRATPRTSTAPCAARAGPFDDGPWGRITPSERGRIIWRIGDLILEHADELAQLEIARQRQALRGGARAADIPLAADLFHYMAGWATKIEGNTINISVPYMPGANFHSYTLREPVGVVGQIIPWNFPLLMAAWKLGPALTTGNTVVLKPAEQTSLTALRLAGLIAEAGVPDGVVNVVTGFGETAGAALAAHPMVDKVAFTGSTEVGKLIVHAAAGNLKKVTLELGGKSPNIVFDDAPDDAVAGAANAIFFNHGQCCVAGSRLFVQQSRFDEVVEGVSRDRQVDQARPGHGRRHPDGPAGLRRAASPGHRLPGLRPGGWRHRRHRRRPLRRHGATSSSPPCITGTRPDMKIVREEIFGPVVVAAPFQSLDDIAAAANDTDYGLGAGIWTKDISKAHALAKKLRAGTVWINCYNVFDAALPFGGYKQSGWGREMGHEALEAYTEVKAVTTLL